MTRLRTRSSFVFLCIAIAVLAGLVPGVASLFCAILTPLWIVVPAVAVTVVRRKATRSDERSIGLVILLPTRAPPIDSVLA